MPENLQKMGALYIHNSVHLALIWNLWLGLFILRIQTQTLNNYTLFQRHFWHYSEVSSTKDKFITNARIKMYFTVRYISY